MALMEPGQAAISDCNALVRCDPGPQHAALLALVPSAHACLSPYHLKFPS